jgi:hypothetical protein
MQYVFNNMHAKMCELFKLVHLPAPDSDPHLWTDVMHHPKWSDLVLYVFFMSSCLDSSCTDLADPCVHVCTICVQLKVDTKTSFATQKALESHQRCKHGIRNNIRLYVGDVEQCPCCETTFGARVSLLAHLSDKRRPKCRLFVFENCPALDLGTVSYLDSIDNDLKKASRKSGRSHHIVSCAAVNAKGRQSGLIFLLFFVVHFGAYQVSIFDVFWSLVLALLFVIMGIGTLDPALDLGFA